MQIKDQSVKGLKHSYKVFLSPDVFQEKVTSYLQDKGSSAKLDGFRPGKAPLDILKKKFGTEATQKVLNSSLDECYRKILTDNKIAPADSPKVEVDSFSAEKGVEISYSFEVLPVIKDIDFSKNIKLEKLVSKVEQKQIDLAIENILSRHKTTDSYYRIKISQTKRYSSD